MYTYIVVILLSLFEVVVVIFKKSLHEVYYQHEVFWWPSSRELGKKYILKIKHNISSLWKCPSGHTVSWETSIQEHLWNAAGVLLWRSRLRSHSCHCCSASSSPGQGTSTCHLGCPKEERKKNQQKGKTLVCEPTSWPPVPFYFILFYFILLYFINFMEVPRLGVELELLPA